MNAPTPLSPDQLRWRCDPDSLGFERVDELEHRKGIIGQDRAIGALELGITLRDKGYNIFVTGPSGSGRTTTVKHVLGTTETDRGEPCDIIIVNSFHDKDRPRPIYLPAGKGNAFARDMEEFAESLRGNLAQIYQGEDFKARRKAAVEARQEEEKAIIQAFEEEVKGHNFALVQISMGQFHRPEVTPMIAGEPVQIERLEQEGKYDAAELKKMKETQHQLRNRLEDTFRKSRAIQRKLKKELVDLEKEFARPFLSDVLGDIRDDYENDQIEEYLKQVQENILTHLRLFLEEEAEDEQPDLPLQDDERYRPYLVNVLVDNEGKTRPPVVVETSPNYRSLFGTIEKVLDRGGVWRSDFLHIRAGSVLKANGGYLVIHLADAMSEPGVWQALVRTLKNQHVDIQSFDPLFLVSTSAIKPEPIEVTVRVIVIGNSYSHHLLNTYDPDFQSVFKVKADFDSVVPRDEQNVQRYASFIRNVVDAESLTVPDKTGVARVVEYGARLAGHGAKLSTLFSAIADILRESNYWAKKDGADTVRAEHVGRAVREKEIRVALPEEKMQEAITDGTIHIDTTGAVVGQINGLSVYDLGDHRFGKPTRITSQTALGNSGIVNIEREADFSGRTFNKAALILDGFFRSHFGQEEPISMYASIAFEQSYGEVDGDSASVAEIAAITSSLSRLPADQSYAVTGSADQYGNVQAVGGINEKIEGFFDICKARTLTGRQGVLIPAANVPDLMLREDVVEACAAGQFAVHAVERVEDALAILLDTPVGERDDEGTFPEESVFRLVEDRLRELGERMKEHNKDILSELAESVDKDGGDKSAGESSEGFDRQGR